MARYPVLDDYKARGNYTDGLKRIDDLLKKSPNDIRLLTTKLELTLATKGDPEPILSQLTSLTPPIRDLSDIVAIEEALFHSARTTYPSASTVGPAVGHLYDAAVKAPGNPGYKVDVQSLRFSRAILDNRQVDAHAALIQLKALQPRNRAVYLAHAALTQMLSAGEGDLQGRLALMLARKAVKDGFEQDPRLDCRVVGQIFALQGSEADLEAIRGKPPFAESQQVFEALRKLDAESIKGEKEVAGDEVAGKNAEGNGTEFEELKQKFSSLATSSTTTQEDLISLATKSITLFHTSLTTTQNAHSRSIANTSFLAISSLIKLSTLTTQPAYLLQAAFLASTLLLHNPHIHEARLILVYLYMRLGLGSLAMRLFDSLSVKEVQHDTIGHALFTRLSTTHPFPTASQPSKREGLDNVKRLSHALSVYTRCEDRLAETQADVLTHGQTGQLFALQSVRDSLSTSLARRITALELRRLARLTQKSDRLATAWLAGPNVTANWATFQDNRDFHAAFDFGFNVERALQAPSPAGAVPGKAWLLFALAGDTVWSRGTEACVQDPEVLEEALSALQAEVTASPDAAAQQGLTAAEARAGEVALCALRLSSPTITGEQAATSITALLDALETLVSNEKERAARPLTSSLNDTLTLLEAIRTANHITNPSPLFPSESAARLKVVHAKCRQLFDALQKEAKERTGEMRTERVKEMLAGAGAGVVGKETWSAMKGFRGDDVHSFCQEVAGAAREGWEGVGRIGLV